MNLIIDIGHPKDIHTFKNLYYNLTKKNIQVMMVCRERDHNQNLLKIYNINYKCLGKHYKTVPGKVYGMVMNEIQLLKIAVDFKADLFLSHNSTIAAHVSKIVNKPHIAIEDTFNIEQTRLSMPFTDVVLTGDYPHMTLGKKELHYPGYHELAYLHPNQFIPNHDVFKDLGLEDGERFAIVRFVAWNATHDIGRNSISIDNKRLLIEQISKYMRVFISSEIELPAELQKYQITIRSDKMHDALFFAHMFVGESSTMATESAMLGTPAIYLNNALLGYIKELTDKYGLIYSYETDIQNAIKKIAELAMLGDAKAEYLLKRNRMLSDKIDVTAFLVWFVENYPLSEKEMRLPEFNFTRFK